MQRPNKTCYKLQKNGKLEDTSVSQIFFLLLVNLILQKPKNTKVSNIM